LFLWLNPLVSFLDSYRDIFYYCRYPDAEHWIAMCGWAVFFLILGGRTFTRLSGKFADEL